MAERDGIILSSLVAEMLPDRRVLARDVERGDLVKLRRGAYVAADRWAESDGRARHILRLRAVDAAAASPVVAAGISAAALWGFPDLQGWPEHVLLLDEWKGGGRSDPGVRRTAANKASALIVEVDGMRATTMMRTALDVARTLSFPNAVAAMDWALGVRCPNPVTKEQLYHDLSHFGPRMPHRHLRSVIAFASELSESVGESKARAVIDRLGFRPPELQGVIVDAEGTMRVDFLWPESRVVMEFDGRMKYTRAEYTGGDPAQVVWREKRREDRLRRLGYTVVRIVWDDLNRPEYIASMLVAAGVSRRR
jgi:hypothetical protein